MRRFAAIVLVIVVARSSPAQTGRDTAAADSASGRSLLASRVSIGIAFGITGISAQDVVAMINQELGAGVVSVNSFASAASLSSHLTWRFSDAFDVAASQMFVSNSYHFGDAVSGESWYSYDLNQFAVLIHRAFVEETYCLAVGAGGGYMLGVLRRSYSTSPIVSPFESRYTANGGVLAFDVTFNSAFGGHLFLRTEVYVATTFSSAVRDAQGRDYPLVLYNRSLAFSTTSGGLSFGLDYWF